MKLKMNNYFGWYFTKLRNSGCIELHQLLNGTKEMELVESYLQTLRAFNSPRVSVNPLKPKFSSVLFRLQTWWAFAFSQIPWFHQVLISCQEMTSYY